MSDVAIKKDQTLLRLLIDFAPLIVFFGVYKYTAPAETNDMVGTLSAIIKSTSAFVVAIIIAAIISRIKLGRISPMMWITLILVVGFGGLTIWFHDPLFVMYKPTAIYTALAVLLFGGLLKNKPMLKYVFEAGYDGLSNEGWLKFSKNWAWFFAFLALLNTVVVVYLGIAGWSLWLNIKVIGVPILTVIFAAANIPMLMKHGLGDDEGKAPLE
jgi:intracellular septation protein